MADDDLGALLAHVARAGYTEPLIAPVHTETAGRSAVTSLTDASLPTEWQLLRELENQSYTWPEYVEQYNPYRVFNGRTATEGVIQIALGEADRAAAWGRDRRYIVAFLSGATPQTPLVEFLEADDHDESGDFVAVIRGADGGRRMYGPNDPLPVLYQQHFRIALYRDQIRQKGAWSKLAVLVNQDDTDGMLNHALLQARRRGDL